MTEIDSNITFENGQITKCVLQIGGKTFTVTLVNSGYNVEDGGTAPCATPTLANADPAAKADVSAANAPGSTSTTSTTSTSTASTTSTTSTQPSQEKEYNTQEDLITTLGSYGFTAP